MLDHMTYYNIMHEVDMFICVDHRKKRRVIEGMVSSRWKYIYAIVFYEIMFYIIFLHEIGLAFHVITLP